MFTVFLQCREPIMSAGMLVHVDHVYSTLFSYGQREFVDI